MPRFFFHLHEDAYVHDREGRELADLATAQAAAVEQARALVARQVAKGYIDLTHRIEIEDETGKQLAKVYFDDAVTVWAAGHEQP